MFHRLELVLLVLVTIGIYGLLFFIWHAQNAAKLNLFKGPTA